MLVKLLTSLFKLSCHNILGHKNIEYPKTQNIEYPRTQNIEYPKTQKIEYHRKKSRILYVIQLSDRVYNVTFPA